MRKFLFFAIILALLSGYSSKAFAVCSGATSGGALSPAPTTSWQTANVSTHRYYTFTAVYPGQTFVFSFCADNGGSNLVDTQIEICNNAGVPLGTYYNDDFCGLGSEIVFTAPAGGVYSIAIYQYYCSTSSVAAGTMAYITMPVPTNGDCLGALPLCNNIESHTYAPVGEGNYYDLFDFRDEWGSSWADTYNNCPNCMLDGELNSQWYTFFVQTSGWLRFTITHPSSEIYDWSLHSLNGGVTCFDLVDYATYPPVSCNWFGDIGVGTYTGMQDAGTSDCEYWPGAGASNPYNDPIWVNSGETYALHISSYVGGTGGYTINFSNSTASIVDNTGPTMDVITSTMNCGAQSITIQFSEGLACSSVQASDFVVTGPAGSYSVTDAWSAVCEAASGSTYSSGTFYDDLWTLELGDFLTQDGNYTVCVLNNSVNDLCGNTAPQNCLNFTITGITANISSTDIACNGDLTGTITVNNITGGTAPYSYTLNGGAPVVLGGTSFNLNALAAGSYQIVISDAIGQCEYIETVVINEPSALGFNTSITHPTCGGGGNDGSVLVTGTGGISPYDIQLGAATQNGVASYNFTGLSGGTYGITVTDNVGCTATGSAVLNVADVPDATFTYNGNQCFTGHSYNFTHTGVPIAGETYSWTFTSGTPASSVAENPSGVTWAAPGIYNVQLVVTTGSCSDTYNTNIEVYSMPSPTVNVTTDNCGLCDGTASTSIAYSGYAWSTGATTATLNSLCAGGYDITVTDANSCTGVAPFTITASGTTPVANVVTTDPTCAGDCDGTATVNAMGPATFSYTYSAGTTPNNQSTGGLCDGAYTVTVADGSNAACFTVENFSITDPPAMVLTMGSVDATCGLANGQASVVVSGHTPPASYNWSNGMTTGTINVAAGNYTVTVTDGNLCTAVGNITVNDAGVPFTVTTSVNNNVDCFGNCNGSATATPVGAGPFTYLWDNTQITPTATGLCAGLHSVTVTEGACSVIETVNITQPSALSVSTINIVDAHCGLPDGSITASAAGGTGVYTNYSWNTTPPQSGVTASAVLSGTYTVTVTDDNGCTAQGSGFVGDIGAISVNVTGSNVLCAGGSTGTATATVTGGSPNYTYVWSNGFNETIAGLTSNATGVPAGNISVVVTDNFGCTATDDVTLTQPLPLAINLVSTVPTTCFGDCDGEAQISVSGGSGPYSYSWSSGSNPNSNLNLNLCGGSHSVQVTDANMCVENLNFNIAEPVELLLNMSTTPANCGNANGTATATPVGGTSPFFYSWSAGGATASMTNTGLSSAGNPYLVTVTDDNGCSQTGSASIVDVPGPTAVISVVTNVGCNGANDGSATVSAASGTPPYSYNWGTTPVQTNPTATNLGPGTYFVTVSDNVGCSTIASTIIGQPAGLNLSIIAPPIDCFGGTNGDAFANVSGGTSPYTFIWNNLQMTQTATNLSAGTYSVTVTDDNSCTITANTTLTQAPAIVANAAITPSNCTQADGAIDLTVNGGSPPYTFAWDSSHFTEDIVGVTAGNYTVTITDNKSCDLIQTYSISDQNGPVATITSSNNITCNGTCNGTATVGVTGGSGLFQYNWSSVPAQTTATATNLCVGNYNVVVTDLTTGCIASTGVNLTEPTLLDLIDVTSNASCQGDCNGSIDITAFGGTAPYTYNWAGPGVTVASEDQSGLCDGNYSVVILDNNNCIATRNFVIAEPTFITVPLTSAATSCNGDCTGTATAAPFGGTPPYFYLWSGTGQSTATATGLCTGMHTVIVTDDNGCTAENSINVSSPTQMVFADVTINDAQCNGSSNASISVTIIGGTPPYDYVWDNGQVISSPTGLQAGQHCVTVLDNNGCMIDTCVLVGEPPVLNVSLNATNEMCNGSCDGTITASPSGGSGVYSYLWSDGEVTPTINNLCAGVYNITVTDDNGCEVYSSTSINSPAILAITVQNIVEPVCGSSNGSITIGATGGTGPFTYAWDPVSGSGSTLGGIPSGSYTVTLTDSHGCSVSQTIGLSDITGPQITDIIVSNVGCNGDASGTAEVIYTSSTINNSVIWSNGQVSDLAINLAEGIYTVTVTDDNGCSAVGSTSITEPTTLSVSIAAFNNVTCAGFCNGTATAQVTGGTTPYTYAWSSGASLQTANNLCAGSYTLTVYDDNGCSATTIVSISEPTPLSVTGDVVHTLCNAGNDGIISIYPSGGTNNYLIDWPQIGENSAIVEGLSAAAYTVVIYDAADASCFITETFIVSEPAPILATFGTENSTCGYDNGVAYVNTIFGGTGSYSYDWNPGGMTGTPVSGLAPGTYSVVVTDGNGCTANYNVTVNATNALSLDNVLYNGVTCYGDANGFAQIFVSGGNGPYNYNWTPNVTDQSSSNTLTAGVYNVEIEDQDGCVVYAQFPISSPEQVVAYPEEGRTICIGQQAIVSASAGGGVPPYTLSWSGLGNGTSFLVSPNTTTNYQVIAYDSRNCASQPAEVPIEVLPPLSLIVTTPSAICQGQISTLVANATGGDGNYVFDWGNGIVTTTNTLDISPLINTDFMVVVSDGCTTPRDTSYVTAIVSPSPEVHLSRNPYTGCAPLSVTFDNNTDNLTYTYYWEFDDEDSGPNNYSDLKRPTHIFNETGLYQVLAVVTTPMGCVDSARVSLNVHDSPIANFVAFPWSTGLFEPEITFEDQSVDAIAWEWNFGDNGVSGSQNPVHVYMEQGEFPVTLTVYSQEGCLDTVTKIIEIIDDHRIYFPTAINLRSPGNDEFYPIGVGVDVDNYQMTIYNRWGEMIFTTKDWSTHWKGRYNMDKGDYVPQGVYTYVVTLRDKYGKDYTYSGTVTVFK